MEPANCDFGPFPRIGTGLKSQFAGRAAGEQLDGPPLEQEAAELLAAVFRGGELRTEA